MRLHTDTPPPPHAPHVEPVPFCELTEGRRRRRGGVRCTIKTEARRDSLSLKTERRNEVLKKGDKVEGVAVVERQNLVERDSESPVPNNDGHSGK